MHSNFNTIGELLEKVLKFEYSMYEIRKVAAWPLISYDTDNNVIVDYIADEWACYQKFPKTELAKKYGRVLKFFDCSLNHANLFLS